MKIKIYTPPQDFNSGQQKLVAKVSKDNGDTHWDIQIIDYVPTGNRSIRIFGLAMSSQEAKGFGERLIQAAAIAEAYNENGERIDGAV